MTIYTLGHSTRSYEELVELLHHYGIERLADVRSVPRSRHTPQFNTEVLAEELPKDGVAYRHFSALGGWRKPVHDSELNAAWRNAGFRGYADYMQTDGFAAGIDELLQWTNGDSTAVMCAEAVPWRCHRSLLADALTTRNIGVIDIIDEKHSEKHALSKLAKVIGATITYPKPADDAPGQERLF